MQAKNTDKVSNGDLGFIRYVEDTPEGKRIGLDLEYDIVLMPMLKAHYIMLYRNLLYTGERLGSCVAKYS